jgi:hypothetical protein
MVIRVGNVFGNVARPLIGNDSVTASNIPYIEAKYPVTRLHHTKTAVCLRACANPKLGIGVLLQSANPRWAHLGFGWGTVCT